MNSKKYILIFLILSIILGFRSCDKEVVTQESESIERVYITQPHNDLLIKTTYCLRDLLAGSPSAGGCWELVSVPAGSAITQAALDGSDNPCFDFDGEPCPGDYVFDYSVLCDCDACKKTARLTICLVCDCTIPQITFTCN